MSVRDGGKRIIEELITSTPPVRILGANLSRDGRLSAMTSVGWRTIGERTGQSETITVQLAVPPRI
jgi:hypothetical protein